MYKQSPSRSHRSKGIKVKHILQTCLLLAVCFWLIYQVKHSHAKRKEFDTKEGKVGVKVHGDGEIQRLGRKDLPKATELATDVEKHEEDEEEKEVEEEEEDENKHEEDEPEKEDNKHEEEVNGGRGDRDDEIDENDIERTDVEAEHEEESVDEDKENEENQGGSVENRTENEENEDIFKEEDHSEHEENESAGKEEHTEESGDVRREDHNGDAASEDQDNDGVNTNTHEAREEQYKADDASSEVAQEIQTINPETGNLTTGQAGEIWGKVSFGQGNETQTPDKEAALIHLVQRRQGMNLSVTSATETVTEQKKYDIDSSKSDDSPLQNSTLPRHQNTRRSTSLLPNGTQRELPSGFSQNATTREGAKHGEEHTSKPELAEVSSNKTDNADRNPQDGSTSGEENTSKSALAEMSSIRTENVNSNVGETLNPGNTTSDRSQETSRTNSMEAAEDSSLKPNEKAGDSGTSGSDENSEPSRASDESAGSIRGSLAQEGGSKTDSGSMPKIRSEIQSTDAKAAE